MYLQIRMYNCIPMTLSSHLILGHKKPEQIIFLFRLFWSVTLIHSQKYFHSLEADDIWLPHKRRYLLFDKA